MTACIFITINGRFKNSNVTAFYACQRYFISDVQIDESITIKSSCSFQAALLLLSQLWEGKFETYETKSSASEQVCFHKVVISWRPFVRKPDNKISLGATKAFSPAKNYLKANSEAFHSPEDGFWCRLRQIYDFVYVTQGKWVSCLTLEKETNQIQ